MPTLIDSYSESNYDIIGKLYSDVPYYGQTFTNTNQCVLQSVKFYIYKVGSSTGNITAKIYALTGTYGTDGKPTGSVLATSGAIDITTLNTTPELKTFTFTGADKITLNASTYYCAVLNYSGGSSIEYVAVGMDVSSPSHSGNRCLYTSGSWGGDNSFDACFYVYADASSASASPSTSPSASASTSPSSSISISPSTSISRSPSISPSTSVSVSPSSSISASVSPSTSVSVSPSTSISQSPSLSPSESISQSPSISPSTSTSISPSVSPSTSISVSPSVSPSSSISASVSPSTSVSVSPSTSISQSPSLSPSVSSSLSPSESPSASPSPSPSRLLYKLYKEDGTYVSTLSDVISDLSITKEINGGDGAFTFTLARKIDDFGEGTDIDFNYRVKVYLFDSFNPTGVLVAYGYILSYEPYLNGKEEGVNITCLSAVSKLSNDYYRLGTSAVASELGVELTDMRADEMMTAVINHYRSTESNSMISAPSSLDQTTDNAGALFDFTLRIFNKKHIEALREISKYFARFKTAGYWFYWRINTAGNLIVKNISTTATHKFVIGKHITNISGSKTMEGMVNRVYFWNEKGTTSSEYLKTTTDDSTSQSSYDIVSEYINDSSVTNVNAANLLSSARIYDNKDPKVKIKITLNGEYNLASIEPGQTCQIFNLKNNPYKLGSDSVLFINSITYEVDSATLEIAEAADDFTDMVQEERDRLNSEMTWFGYISQQLTASQLGPADRTWSTNITFVATPGADSYRVMSWSSPSGVDGAVYLATSIANSAGKRIVADGNTGNMAVTTPPTDYYIYLNEDTINVSATASLTGTGIIQQGSEYLTDSTKSWTSNQWQGYIVTFGTETRIVRSNTLTVLTLEESWLQADTSANYSEGTYIIRKMTFDVTTDKNAVASTSNVIFAVAKANANTASSAGVSSVDGTSVVIDGDTQIATDSIPSENIYNLYVDKLSSGTFNSKTITLASTTGSCYLNAGKTSFTDTANGFILGLDHADDDYAKFIIGDATHYLSWNGTDLTLYGGSVTADAGYLGGWAITATTLSSTSNEIILDSDNSQIKIGATTPIIIDGNLKEIESDTYVSGTMGSGFHIDENLAEFGNISARGILRSASFQKDNISVMGGNFLVLDGDVLDSDMTALDASTLKTKGTTSFAVGDILRIKDGAQDEWFEVTNIASAPVYSVNRDKDAQYSANNNPIWTAGTTVVNYKQSGAGGVYITASETNAPYLSIFDHAGSPWDTVTTRLRIGNLNGFLGYSTNLYGIAIGETDSYLKYDGANGLRVKGNVSLTGGEVSVDYLTTGTFTSKKFIMSHVDDQGDCYIASSNFVEETWDGDGAIGIGIDDSDGDKAKAFFGNATKYLKWDGTNLMIAGGIINFYFGTGEHGYAHFNGVHDYSATFATLSGSTYTLTADLHATNIYLEAGITLKTNGYAIFYLGEFICDGIVSGSGTAGGNGDAGIHQESGSQQGIISNGGTAGVGGGSVGSTFGQAKSGEIGGLAQVTDNAGAINFYDGVAGDASNPSLGSSGAAGGNSANRYHYGVGYEDTNKTGGGAGTATTEKLKLMLKDDTEYTNSAFYIKLGLSFLPAGVSSGFALSHSAGSGSGAAGASIGGNYGGLGIHYLTGGGGGGSGGAGGIVYIAGTKISGSGSIESKGGNGGNGGASAQWVSQYLSGCGGGGAGGAGGVIIIIRGVGTVPTLGISGGTGGTKGSGNGGGDGYVATNGADGNSAKVYQFIVS